MLPLCFTLNVGRSYRSLIAGYRYESSFERKVSDMFARDPPSLLNLSSTWAKRDDSSLCYDDLGPLGCWEKIRGSTTDAPRLAGFKAQHYGGLVVVVVVFPALSVLCLVEGNLLEPLPRPLAFMALMKSPTHLHQRPSYSS